ncbi:MAG: hypothetical protein B7Z55_12580, partial [Planctomycetales bacterium 12-60-4]
PAAAATESAPATETASSAVGEAGTHPVLPPDIVELFLSRRANVPAGGELTYRPGLYGTARVHFENRTAGVDESHDYQLLISAVEEVSATVWDHGKPVAESLDFDPQPESSAGFAPLLSELSIPKSYASISTALKDHLYRTERLPLDGAGESHTGDTKAACKKLLGAINDPRHGALHFWTQPNSWHHFPKLNTLQERIRKAEQRKEKEQSQASSQTLQAAMQFGTSILGAMFGRKLASSTNLTRASSTIRSASRAAEQRQDVAQAEETIQSLQQQFADLDAEFAAEVQKIQAGEGGESLVFDEVLVRPKKTDITVTKLALVWTPWIVAADGTASPGWE